MAYNKKIEKLMYAENGNSSDSEVNLYVSDVCFDCSEEKAKTLVKQFLAENKTHIREYKILYDKVFTSYIIIFSSDELSASEKKRMSADMYFFHNDSGYGRRTEPEWATKLE